MRLPQRLLCTCDSGSFISNLKGDHRIIITATQWDETAWIEMGSSFNHWAFLYEGAIQIYGVTVSTYPGFILSMGDISDPQSLYNAYECGHLAALNNYGAIIINGIPIIVADGRSHSQLNNLNLAKEVYI